MKSKTITSTFIKTIILALILLLAGQATHLPAGAAGGEDDQGQVSDHDQNEDQNDDAQED